VAKSGYRVIANTGGDGHKEVPHLHFHVIGGRDVGPMLARRSE
jgi:diadenosine tetraphosphate (Ap4A) HIT family hydrolase